MKSTVSIHAMSSDSPHPVLVLEDVDAVEYTAGGLVLRFYPEAQGGLIQENVYPWHTLRYVVVTKPEQ